MFLSLSYDRREKVVKKKIKKVQGQSHYDHKEI